MIAVITLLKRKADLTPQEFGDYWRNNHRQLVESTPDVVALMRRYVQYHLQPGQGRVFGAAGEFDGVVEAWFDSREDMEALNGLQSYREIIRPDERRFIDIERCVSYVTEPLVVHDAV